MEEVDLKDNDRLPHTPIGKSRSSKSKNNNKKSKMWNLEVQEEDRGGGWRNGILVQGSEREEKRRGEGEKEKLKQEGQ